MTRKDLLRWLAILALLSLFSSGQWALAPVAWIAPVLGLYIIHRTPAFRGFLLLLATLYVPTSIAWYGVVPFPFPIYPIFMLFNTFVGGLPFLLDRLLAPRVGGRFVATLVFPIAATAVEYLLMAEGPLGSFGAQAYTQYAFAPLVQLSAVTGLWGITFLVSWFAAVAHWAVSRHEAGVAYRRGLAVCGAVLFVVMGAGLVRLLAAPTPEQSVTVAAITAEHTDMVAMMALRASDEAAFREATRARHEAYLQQSARAMAAGSEIVMWPELAGLGMADDVESLIERGRALADENDVYLVMPLYVLDPANARPPINKVVVAGPDGEIALEHIKYGGNLLEGSMLGSGKLQTIETPFGTLSVVICWDTDYPGVVRQAGAQGVDILLSPAYVWPEVAAMHAEMATFRAVENGLTVVRHSDNGMSVVSDAYGRIRASKNFVGQGSAQFTAEAPLMTVDTLYPDLGDVVGQLSLGGLALMVIGRPVAWVARRGRGFAFPQLRKA